MTFAAKAFCEDDKNVSVMDKGLKCTKIFDWYKEDFGRGDGYELAVMLRAYLKGSKLESLE